MFLAFLRFKDMSDQLLPLLVFDLSCHSEVVVDHHLVITSTDQNSAGYRLRGIIYFGHHHFTSRFVSHHEVVWYHDGLVTGSSLINEGTLESVDLSRRGSLVVTATLYEKETSPHSY